MLYQYNRVSFSSIDQNKQTIFSPPPNYMYTSGQSQYEWVHSSVMETRPQLPFFFLSSDPFQVGKGWKETIANIICHQNTNKSHEQGNCAKFMWDYFFSHFLPRKGKTSFSYAQRKLWTWRQCLAHAS